MRRDKHAADILKSAKPLRLAFLFAVLVVKDISSLRCD